jgi:hypothetical protein
LVLSHPGAAPGSEERTKCSYFIQTDYSIGQEYTDYNIVFENMTSTSYVPATTTVVTVTTSITETRVRTHRKDDTVVLASTCSWGVWKSYMDART